LYRRSVSYRSSEGALARQRLELVATSHFEAALDFDRPSVDATAALRRLPIISGSISITGEDKPQSLLCIHTAKSALQSLVY
jgi:hypothetical protein